MTARHLDVALATGVTYRQLVYWKGCGYIRPSRPAGGSGGVDVWDAADLARLRTIAVYCALVRKPHGPCIAAIWRFLAADPFTEQVLVVTDHVVDALDPDTTMDDTLAVLPSAVLLLRHEGSAGRERCHCER